VTTTDEVKKILREEMDARGYHNDDYRAGLAAIVGGESAFIPQREVGWSHSSNQRIRHFFSRARGLSDARLNELKADDRTWFNFLYGGLGGNRPGTDDGYDYRGGGLNQLTFRDNYAALGPRVGVDLVAHPELIVVPRVAAAVAVEYMILNFHGGTFTDQKRAVGVSMGGPDDRKNELYAGYRRTGEWDYAPAAPEPHDDPVPPAVDPVVRRFLDSLQEVERFLKNESLYTGPIDRDPGPGLRAALREYLRSFRV